MKFIINLFAMFWISASCYSMDARYYMGNSTDIFERARSYAFVELVNEHNCSKYIKSAWQTVLRCELNVDTVETYTTDCAFQLLRYNGFILDAHRFDELTAEIAALIQTN